MKKVAINKCFGGFDLSNEAIKMLVELKYNKPLYVYKQIEYEYENGIDKYVKTDINEKSLCLSFVTKDYGDTAENIADEDFVYKHNLHENREDKDLIYVIETLGDRASGQFGNLKVVEIPDDVKYEIDDYDGIESIHEIHRVWK